MIKQIQDIASSAYVLSKKSEDALTYWDDFGKTAGVVAGVALALASFITHSSNSAVSSTSSMTDIVLGTPNFVSGTVNAGANFGKSKIELTLIPRL